MENAYTRSGPQVLKHFGVDAEKGLSAKAVEAAREKYGSNCE
jgi:hypothetical protein